MKAKRGTGLWSQIKQALESHPTLTNQELFDEFKLQGKDKNLVYQVRNTLAKKKEKAKVSRVIRGSLRKFIESNPDASVEEIQKETGCSRASAFNAKGKYGKNGLITQGQVLDAAAGAAATGLIQSPVGIQMDVSSGVQFKMMDRKRMMGTVNISPHGLSFIKANGKKKPSKILPWALVQTLIQAAEQLG